MGSSRRESARLISRGFTLIELMVVVSIIALLIALSLPSLSKARARTSQTTCGTKVRGLGQAMHLYLSDFDGTFPINGMIMPKSGVPAMYQGNTRYTSQEVPFTDKERWRPEYGALWIYMGGTAPGPQPTPAPPLPRSSENMTKRYICQIDSQDGLLRSYADTTPGNGPLTLVSNASNPPVVGVGPGAPGYWSYSVNSVFNSLGRFRNRFNANELPWSDPIKIVNIKSPANLIVFVEEDNASLFNDEVFDAPAYSQGDFITKRHLGGGNVGFCDGHVEFFNQTLFDEVPSGISGTYVSHSEAMTSPFTRMFFPDGGSFVGN